MFYPQTYKCTHSFKRNETKLCNLFYVENAICLFQCISVYFSIVLFVFQVTSFFHVQLAFFSLNTTAACWGKNWQKVKWLQYVSCVYVCICVSIFSGFSNFFLFHSEVRLVDAVFFHQHVNGCVCSPRKILAFNVCEMCRLLLLLLELFSFRCALWVKLKLFHLIGEIDFDL